MKASTLSLSVALLASLGYSAYLQWELGQLRAERETRPAFARTLSQVENSEFEQRLERSASATETSVVAAAAQTSEEESQPNQWQRRRQEQMQRMQAVFSDPVMRVDMIEREMNRVDERYADFFKTLNLSPEELDTLRALMAERNVINWEMRMRRFGAEDDAAREEIAEERRFQRDVLADEIEELLGEDKSVALADYSESLPYRREVEALVSSLSYTDFPLNDNQAEAVVQTLRRVEENFEYTSDLSRRRGPELAGVTRSDVQTYFAEREQRDSQILESLSASLSDDQLTAYAERQLSERERDRRQMEFMIENPPPSGGPWDGRGPRRGP